MKKITLLLLLCFCAVGVSMAQIGLENSGTATSVISKSVSRNIDARDLGTKKSAVVKPKKTTPFTAILKIGTVRANHEFSLDISGLVGPSNWNAVTGTATRLATLITSQNLAPVTITHSVSQIIGTNAVACASPTTGVSTENHYYRDFDLANDFGIAGDFNVTAAEFAVQGATESVEVTVKIWSSSDGAFPMGNLVLEGTSVYTSTPADQGTVVSVPVTATIPAGAVMVFEFIQADGSIWRIGSNDLGQTGVTWISAAVCGLTDPTDGVAIGFSDFHVIMNVVGEEDGTNLGTVDNTIEGFVYYPNPTESILTLSAQDTIESVAIYNMLGQKVVDQNVNAIRSEVNVSELATGAYLMRVSVNGQIGIYKILKK